MSSDSPQPEAVDLLIENAIGVTMDPRRTVINSGALAVRKDRIVAVGKTADLRTKYTGATTIDASRFVITPGLNNRHIRIAGEPLTRGYVPDNVAFDEHVFQWLAPIHRYFTH